MGLLRDAELERIYARSRGPVAFCDESHRVGQRGAVGFYTITGVLYDRAGMVSAREELAAVAGPRAWHTTEEFEAGRDDRIHQMLEVVAGHSEWGIVTVEAPIDGHTAQVYAAARRACLSALLPELTRGANPVRVVVMDTLGDDRADGADRRLFSELRGNASLPRGTLVRHADDKHEPLLWAPDVVGWAVRRLLARDEPGWFQNIADVTTVLDAHSGRHVDVAQICNSAAAAAAPTAPDGIAGLTPTKVDSARPSLLPTRSSHELFAAASMAAGRALSDFLAQAGASRAADEKTPGARRAPGAPHRAPSPEPERGRGIQP